MKEVQVRASRTYNVLIGSGLLPTLGQEVKKVCKATKAAIVSETNVFPLHGQAAFDSLQKAG